MNWQERADKIIAQGCNCYSRHPNQYVGLPSHIIEGHGCYLKDHKGDYYLDFVCGLGSNLISAQYNTTLPSFKEVQLAERLCEIFPMDKVKLLKTGSEACQAAVRIARAYHENNDFDNRMYTGAGTGYHGIANVFQYPGTGTKDEHYVEGESIDTIIHTIKCGIPHCYVIIEPIQLDNSNGHYKKLKELRKICTDKNVVLIFDEIVTGFRFPNYCVSNYLEIEPDLICLGKGIANGLPLAVVGGKKEFMNTPDYFISSTYSGEIKSIESALGMLEFLNEGRIFDLWCLGDWFQQEFNKLHPEVQIIGYPTRGEFRGDKIYEFWQEMAKRKYLFGRAWFIGFNHTKELLEKTLEDSASVLSKIDKIKLKFKPKPVFQRN